MRLKTKLIIALSLLVLVVVATASGLYLASILREQMSGIYASADFVSREIFNEVRQEVQSAAAAGLVDLRQPADAEQFMSGLDQSASLTTLMNSAIGYPVTSAVRDVAVVNADGRVLADSDPQLVGQILPPRSQLQAVTGGSWWRQLQAIFGAEEVYEVSLPLLLGTHPLGAIRVGVDTALVRAALASRIRAISFYGLLIVVVATLLAVAFSDFALSPLNALSAQLDRVARGEEAALGTARWGSEVGRVSSKIELLGRQIQDARQIYTHLQESVTQVLEGLEEGVVLFGPDGRALMASAAAQRFLAMAPAQVVGRPVEEVFPSQSSLDRAVRVAVQQETTLGLREVERQPGARRLLARVDRLGEGERASALLVLRDAERVHRLEDLVEVARRLSAVGRLTHGVAHEVKNPLNAMAIHLDLLRAKAQGQGLEQHLDIMRHELDRLDWVVKTFLDFTRPVEVRLRPVDLAEVAAGVRDLVADEAATRGIEVEVESEGPVMLWADRDLVEQVLLNLVNNGIEASADRLAKANGRRGGGARVVMAVGREGDEAVARVRDQGAGVEEEIRDKIFDLYFSTKANGSGLGLAIAARVMQLHNGSIELEPSDGTETGATFCLRFPVREGAAAEAAAEAGAEAEA